MATDDVPPAPGATTSPPGASAGRTDRASRASVDTTDPPPVSDRSLLATAALALGGVLVLLSFLLLTVLGSQHDVELRHVPLTLVGPDAAVAKERRQLDAAPGRQFDLRTSATFGAARKDLEAREVQGVLVLRGDGSQKLYVASAASTTVMRQLDMTLSAAAMQAKTPYEVSDLAPLPKGDSGGSSTFGLALALAIGGLLGSAALFLVARTVPFVARAGVLAVYCLLAGAIGAVIVDPILGALTGSFVEVWLVGALIVASVAFATQGLQALLGAPGTIVAAVVLVILSNTSSGGGGIPQSLPDPLRQIGGYLPAANATDALRGVVYFDGAGTTHPLIVLGIFAVAGLTIGLVGNLLLGRPRPGRVTPLGAR